MNPNQYPATDNIFQRNKYQNYGLDSNNIRNCCPCPPPRTCPTCPPCPPEPCKASFAVVKRDLCTGEPLADAEYGLYQDDKLVASSRSDASGRLCFHEIAAGHYDLCEIEAPPGYQKEAAKHCVIVNKECKVFINEVPADEYCIYDVPLAPFTFYKLDAETCLPLAGAVFCLSNGKSAESDYCGLVDFGVLEHGTYTMEEVTAPEGYQPNTNVYTVKVHRNGEITVDGIDSSEFLVCNIPVEAAFPFAFRKYDACSGNPLPGVEFTLSDGRTAVSDGGGLVNFGELLPGTYTMTETGVPDGYALSTTVYYIVVQKDGEIMINGTPLYAFFVFNSRLMSQPPTVSDICEDDQTVSGYGIPGSTITVLFPDCTAVETVVAMNGTWCVDVPSSVCLRACDVVCVYQTQPGYMSSEIVNQTVMACCNPAQ